jgi:hypothetical protein
VKRALAASVAALVCTVVTVPTGVAFASAPESADAESAAVSWGGTDHRTRTSLEGWLLARGVGYETWAERHTRAAARLELAPAVDRPSAGVLAPDLGGGPMARPPVPLLLLGPLVLGLVLLGCAVFFASTRAPGGMRAPRLVLALHRGAFEIAGVGMVLVLAAVTGYLLAL